MDFEAILTQAHAAAAEAELGMKEGFGLDCGFAWVRISGKTPLATYCRKMRKMTGHPFPTSTHLSREHYYGNKGYPTGWTFWCPGNFRGQSVGVHEKGAEAFKHVLIQHGISAESFSRLD